jgi:hypothetical protein
MKLAVVVAVAAVANRSCIAFSFSGVLVSLIP